MLRQSAVLIASRFLLQEMLEEVYQVEEILYQTEI